MTCMGSMPSTSPLTHHRFAAVPPLPQAGEGFLRRRDFLQEPVEPLLQTLSAKTERP